MNGSAWSAQTLDGCPHSSAVAAIELGGTKLLCRVVLADGTLLTEERFATSTPDAAMNDIEACVETALGAEGRLRAVGVASFGPIVVDPMAEDYGRILETPKSDWSGFDLFGALRERLHAPILVDTDVNAAVLAEHRLGSGRGFSSIAYVTVGTGIGGALSANGNILRGALHPEIGHLRIGREKDDLYPGCCPFHDDCVEGLASGRAIAGRLGEGFSLDKMPETRDLVVRYLGRLSAMLVLTWAPARIVFGGGVMKGNALLSDMSNAMRDVLSGYGPSAAREEDYLTMACLEDAGLEGAHLMVAGYEEEKKLCNFRNGE